MYPLKSVKHPETGLFGYVNPKGEVVIEAKFLFVRSFSEGAAAAALDDFTKFGFIDVNGEWLVPPRFRVAYFFSEGRAVVELDGEGWGHIDVRGRSLCGFEYSDIGDFHEGLASVCVNNRVGFIDHRGSTVISPTFDLYYNCQFHEGRAAVSVDGRWGYVDKSGHFVIEAQFEHACAFSEGLAAVKKDGRWGYIDRFGTLVIPNRIPDNDKCWPEYPAGPFTEGLALVSHKNGRRAFINASGDIVIKPVFYEALSFSEGLAPVTKGKDWGFIDRSGHWVIDASFDGASRFRGGLASVVIDGLEGFVNPHGQMIWHDSFFLLDG